MKNAKKWDHESRVLEVSWRVISARHLECLERMTIIKMKERKRKTEKEDRGVYNRVVKGKSEKIGKRKEEIKVGGRTGK